MILAPQLRGRILVPDTQSSVMAAGGKLGPIGLPGYIGDDIAVTGQFC